MGEYASQRYDLAARNACRLGHGVTLDVADDIVERGLRAQAAGHGSAMEASQVLTL